MGSYNKEYENYYKNVSKTKAIESEQNSANVPTEKSESYYDEIKVERKTENVSIFNNLINTLITTAIICMMMLVVLYSFKFSSGTLHIYEYAKNIISTSFNYNELIDSFNKSLSVNTIIDNDKVNKQSIDHSNLDSSEVKPFDGFVVIKKTTQDLLKENSIQPLNGKVQYIYNDDSTIKDFNVIALGEDKEAKVIYNGTVKEVGQDNLYGNYVLVDHGNGIETKYGNLNSVTKAKGDKVNVGDIIGQVSNNSTDKMQGLILQVINNDKIVDPKEYLNFK